MKRRASDQLIFAALFCAALTSGIAALAPASLAQEPDGPQTSAPAAVDAPARPATVRRNGNPERVNVPAGTRVAVVLENGISTRNGKAGDSVYMRTLFPITQNNRVVIPIGSYVRGELLESKRPGRIKGRGEFRMRLTTLIFPNG
jgi:hypothetical protein